MNERYIFLPWLRKGLSNQIVQPANARSRATVLASAELSDGERNHAPIEHVFQLTGPGDVTGIDPDTIVRSEPKNWITDFEPNYLPFIEFYDEDFPWRYTPRGPEGAGNRRLIPWITLLVLKPDEFERNRLPGRPQSSVVLKVEDPAEVFPPDDELWAWAHSQLVADLGAGDAPNTGTLNARLDANPDAGLSRILSPRKLDPEEAYHAFLIPTFEVGRKAGLGLKFTDEDSSGLELAWAAAGEFPIYHEWFFRTGERGDFEELARRLIPRVVDPRVGIRDMDVGDPGFGMPQLAGNSPHRIVGLEGALKSPSTQSVPHARDASFPPDMADIVNAPGVAEQSGDGDPLVAPPIYGRWHALVNAIDPRPQRRGWVDGLNRDARHRAAAGLGAEVVRRHQEKFMQRAWEQVGEVLEANRQIALAQAAAQANKKLLARTLEAKITPNQTLALAGSLAKRVLAADKTVRADLTASLMTKASLAGPMRKLVRERGPVAKALSPAQVAADPTLPRLDRFAAKLNADALTAGPQPAKITAVTFEDGVAFLADRDIEPNPQPSRPPTGPTRPTVPTRPTFPGGGRPTFPTRPNLPTRLGRPTIPLEPGRPGLGGAAPIGTRPDLNRLDLPGRRALERPPTIGLEVPPIVIRRDTFEAGAVIRGPSAAFEGLFGGAVFSGAVLEGVNTSILAEVSVANRFTDIGLSKDTILALEPSDTFRVSPPPGSQKLSADAPVLGQVRHAALIRSMAEISNLVNFEVPAAPARPVMNAELASTRIVAALQPERAFRRRLDARITIGPHALDHFAGTLVGTVKERIVPAMACPDFKDPMYACLNKLGDEYFVPNLGLIPPNTISLMVTNPSFIEAFMVGVNVEFSSELLFREYPTDQRCSAFRQFWDVASIPRDPKVSEADHIAALKDIEPIHAWGRNSRLGTNSPRMTDGARVVLVIRGDLLRKYPNAIIYAQTARWGSGERANELILHDENGARAANDINDPDIHFPAFKAKVGPDLHFIGFNLALEDVRGHPDLEETASARASISASELGKYFVIQEVVGEARFGLDVARANQPSGSLVDDLAWSNVDLSGGPIVDLSKGLIGPLSAGNPDGLSWGANAADMAAMLYQKPAMLAIHGKDMLKDV